MLKKFDNKKIGLTDKELKILTSLNTPEKIQDFISAIPQNFEPDGDSCMSVREVLAKRRAHCIEGALVAALALWIHGEKPLILDLVAGEDDFDHVVTVFKRNGCWGAISKGNHAYTRYRDPVYRTLRELAMSYFHEYYDTRGVKTLRSYSIPHDLSKYKSEEWITGVGAWKVAEDLEGIRHFKLITAKQAKSLRVIENVERKAAAITVHSR